MADKFADGRISDEELTAVSGGGYQGPCIHYILQRGDTLSRIAARYCTTVEILMELNGIENVNRIYAGDELLIPAR